MPTFAELQQRQQSLAAKIQVLEYLVEHIDSNFRPVAGGEPTNRLLNENNVAVPQNIFEDVVTNTLLRTASTYRTELESILHANMAPAAAAPVPTQHERKGARK